MFKCPLIFRSFLLTLLLVSVNKNRIKEVGPDCAAAEWLIRNGSSIKWANSDAFQSDYSHLSKIKIDSRKLEEIDASNSSIMDVGFDHLDGLTDLKKIIITNNEYISDWTLEKLIKIENSLEYLKIQACPKITDNGLLKLIHLKKLKELYLINLPGIKEKDNVMTKLQQYIPNCKIIWI